MFKIRSKHTNQFQKQLSLNTIQNSPSHQQRYITEHNQISRVNSNTIPQIVSKRTKAYPRNTDTMTIYTCKDKAEEYFSKKIRNVIENDPTLKNESATAFYNTRRDQWKPEGYLYYDFLLKHPLMIQDAAYMNKFGRKLPKINSHEIKNSQAKSKIFSTENDNTSTRQSSLDYYNKLFNKETEKTITETINKEENENDNDNDKQNKEEEFLKTSPITYRTASIRYTDSDILNLKTDYHILDKSGETYLFKKQQKDPHIFTTTTESKSDWVPKQLKRLTLMNHTSVKHNVISPSHKAWSYTKDDVKQSNDIFYKINSVSQFVDLTRVSAPNLNKEHTQTLRDNKSPFAKTNNIGANYQDMHHTYRELFKKSFWK